MGHCTGWHLTGRLATFPLGDPAAHSLRVQTGKCWPRHGGTPWVAAGNLQSAGPALVGVKEGFIAKSPGGTKLSTQAFNAGPFGGR